VRVAGSVVAEPTLSSSAVPGPLLSTLSMALDTPPTRALGRSTELALPKLKTAPARAQHQDEYDDQPRAEGGPLARPLTMLATLPSMRSPRA
jgi:hypothetical protein